MASMKALYQSDQQAIMTRDFIRSSMLDSRRLHLARRQCAIILAGFLDIDDTLGLLVFELTHNMKAKSEKRDMHQSMISNHDD